MAFVKNSAAKIPPVQPLEVKVSAVAAREADDQRKKARTLAK